MQIYNPATNMLFPGSIVPVSAQSQALLTLYPMPNVTRRGKLQLQSAGSQRYPDDSVQSRASRKYYKGNQFNGTLAYQEQDGQSKNLFGFQDTSQYVRRDRRRKCLAARLPSRRHRLFFDAIQIRIQPLATGRYPYFASRTNVSGEAGIMGNDQSPKNWGPPDLSFLSVASPFRA